jgi:hypothetical protein
MAPLSFLAGIGPRVREQISPDLGRSNWTAMSFMAKLWYGNKDLHYEIWVRERLRTIEVGLHFEADPLTNARLLAAFTANGKAIRRALVGARIEEWDRGWARVWEPVPLRRMDAGFAADLADRTAAYVNALEPILRRELPSDVTWSEPGPAARTMASARSRASRRAR